MADNNDFLKADYDNKKFVLIITVCENGNTIEIQKLKEDAQITYQEIIGALEICKCSFIEKLSANNRKAFEKHKAEGK